MYRLYTVILLYHQMLRDVDNLTGHYSGWLTLKKTAGNKTRTAKDIFVCIYCLRKYERQEGTNMLPTDHTNLTLKPRFCLMWDFRFSRRQI
jgi:hypothetical protein